MGAKAMARRRGEAAARDSPPEPACRTTVTATDGASAAQNGSVRELRLRTESLREDSKGEDESPQRLWRNHYISAVENMAPERLQKIQDLFRECTKQQDVAAARIDKRMFQEQFAQYFDAVGSLMADRLFDVLADNSGTVSYNQLVSALYMWGEGTMQDKLRLLFGLWETQEGGLRKEDLKALMLAVSKGSVVGIKMMMEAQRMTQKDMDGTAVSQIKSADSIEARALHVDEVDEFLETFFLQIDSNMDDRISLEEWLNYAGSEEDIIHFLQNFVLPVDLSSWRRGSMSS